MRSIAMVAQPPSMTSGIQYPGLLHRDGHDRAPALKAGDPGSSPGPS